MAKNIKKRDIQIVSIGMVKPYTNNPRENTKSIRHLEKAIKEYGFTTPITVDEDYVIVTGHSRYFAAKNLGLTEIPIIVLDDLSEAQIKQYRIADNKVQEHTSFNFDGHENFMQELTKDDELFGDVFSDFRIEDEEEDQEEEDDWNYDTETDDEEEYDEDEEEDTDEEYKDCICPYCLHEFDLDEALEDEEDASDEDTEE